MISLRQIRTGLLAVVMALMGHSAHADVRTLTHVGEIRSLSREEAMQKLPVEIRGVVTLRTQNGCFVHDGEQNIWANHSKLPRGIVTGSIVEIEGITDQIGYSPRIIITRLKLVGTGELPPARRVTTQRLLSGTEDSQRLEVEGVVQQVIPASGRYPPMLLVDVEGHLCRTKVFRAWNRVAADLVDARVRIRGVYQPQVNLRSQAVGIELYISDEHDIEILVPPPPDPFLGPRVELRKILTFSTGERFGHRKVVEGCVTFTYPGEFFYLQDGATALRVDTNSEVRIGDKVQVAGFVTVRHTLASLDGSLVRKLGEQSPPPPREVTAAQILHPKLSDPWSGSALSDQSGMVLRLKGRLIRISIDESRATKSLMMESDGEIFSAFLPIRHAEGASWAVGSDLELTGACELDFKEDPQSTQSITHPIGGFHLWLSSPGDIRVISTPAWWTVQRLSLALGGVLAILLAAIVWGNVLRREVNRKGMQLAEEISKQRETKLEFETILRERTRLAYDLHDSLEQTLAGLSLQLQAAELFRFEQPERGTRHLHLAQQFLDRSREDLHRTVWGLRVLDLEGGGLVETLRERVKGMGADDSVRFEVTAGGTPFPLPDLIAGNLLLLAQEAMTNALKHARAQAITAHVEFREDGVTVSVTDDGSGFDPKNAPNHREGHFGLQGMRERVKRLGGELRIRASPGQGTCIEAEVPLAAVQGEPILL